LEKNTNINKDKFQTGVFHVTIFKANNLHMKNISTHIYIFLSNNMLVNNILIYLISIISLQLSARQWKAFFIIIKKPNRKNAGFSHREEIEKALIKLKKD